MASEYLAPTILSARRLFGPNVFDRSAGAVLEVECITADAHAAVEYWPTAVHALAHALAWPSPRCMQWTSATSAQLFLTAPRDGLLTASDLSEFAWVAAERHVQGVTHDLAPVIKELQRRAAAEATRWHGVIEASAWAERHDLNVSMDDDGYAIGSGVGACVVTTSPLHPGKPPAAAALREAFDVPIVVVTGSNGKTTTTRLIAAMARADGYATGWCCSDGVWVDDQQIERGDFTGPSGARRVLSDRRVEFAVLETARGGMLRRGLALTHSRTAVITNISADHFGEYGVSSLADLTTVKSTVARTLHDDATLVLNADDIELARLGTRVPAAVAYFSAQPVSQDGDASDVLSHNARFAAREQQGTVQLWFGGVWHEVGPINAMPITLGGRARHNVANVLAASLAACASGVSLGAIRNTLAQFGAQLSDNPGRLMQRSIGDVTVIMDYAHNPDGITSLCRTAASMPAARRLLLIGQAGDRDDAHLRALATAAWNTVAFDRVIIKEMTAMLRGRAVGEIPRVLTTAFVEAGADAHAVTVAPSELAGVREAFIWARPGDLLVLGVHVTRDAVLAFVQTLLDSAWRSGMPVPDIV
ncbi:MAG: Mur ligase [Gemmatimonadaceae bacterium]|nr:Mur ligase [Gemmatimonadaceae bacterium]